MEYTIVGYRPFVSKKTGHDGYIVFLQRPALSPAIGTECRVIYPLDIDEPVIGTSILVG